MGYVESLQVSTVLAYVFMISMNVISNTMPWNDKTNADVSNKYPTKYAPRVLSLTFQGLIFVATGIYTVYQALPRHRYHGGFVTAVGVCLYLLNLLLNPKVPVTMNFIFNGMWAVPFAYEVMVLSVFVMLCILGTLLWIYLSLDIGGGLGLVYCGQRSDEEREHQYLGEAAKLLPDDERDSIKSQITVYWCVQFPFSLYLGWISVATIANVAVTLVYYGINTWDSGWSIVMQVVATGLAMAMLLTRLDVTYSCVIIWSLLGIATKQTEREVVSSAYWMVGLLSLATVITFGWRMYKMYRWAQNQKWEPRAWRTF